MASMLHPIVSARKTNTDYALRKLNQQAFRIERGFLGQKIAALTENRFPGIAGLVKGAVDWSENNRKMGWLAGKALESLAWAGFVSLVDHLDGGLYADHIDHFKDLEWGLILGLSFPANRLFNARRAGRTNILIAQLISEGKTAEVAKILSPLKEGTRDFIIKSLYRVNDTAAENIEKALEKPAEQVLHEPPKPAPKPKPAPVPAPKPAPAEPKGEEEIDLAAALDEADTVLGTDPEKK